MAPKNEWRKRQIILDPEIVRALGDWHSGMDAIYALSSTGDLYLVSLSMIDAALNLLEREERGIKVRLKEAKQRKDKSIIKSTGSNLRHINKLIGDLKNVRIFWKENSAKEAGMSNHDDGYDGANYGFSPEEEAEIDVHSG